MHRTHVFVATITIDPDPSINFYYGIQRQKRVQLGYCCKRSLAWSLSQRGTNLYKPVLKISERPIRKGRSSITYTQAPTYFIFRSSSNSHVCLARILRASDTRSSKSNSKSNSNTCAYQCPSFLCKPVFSASRFVFVCLSTIFADKRLICLPRKEDCQMTMGHFFKFVK